MELTIITPNGIYLKQQVDKASFPGTLGSFTVMQNHAPMLSTLTKGKIQYKAKGRTENQAVEIEDGLVKIEQNQIWIFIEHIHLKQEAKK